MPIPPPAEDDAEFGEAFGSIDEDDERASYDPFWFTEELGEGVEQTRVQTEKLLNSLRAIYGWLLPCLLVFWFFASFAIVFLTGFSVASFEVNKAIEISAYTSTIATISVPIALIVKNLFSLK